MNAYRKADLHLENAVVSSIQSSIHLLIGNVFGRSTFMSEHGFFEAIFDFRQRYEFVRPAAESLIDTEDAISALNEKTKQL